MTTSAIIEKGTVLFPDFTGERVHMREFKKSKGLPADLKRWQRTVDMMLEGVDTDESIFIMIDQMVVTPGMPHRRPGVHIDGCWVKTTGYSVVTAGDEGQWKDDPSPDPRWKSVGEQGILLASNVMGCKAYLGEYEGKPMAGGDCSHIPLKGLEEVELKPHRCYMGESSKLLHESVPLPLGGPRTLVRLSVDGLHPFDFIPHNVTELKIPF